MSRGETEPEVMDVPLQGQDRDMGHDRPQSLGGTEHPYTGPEQSTATAGHTKSETEETPASGRTGLEKSHHSLTDDVPTNENCCLISQHQHASTPNQILRAEADSGENPVSSLQNGHAPPMGLANGAPPICTPPTVSAAHPGWRLAQPPKCSAKASHDKKRLPSTSTNSQNSLKTTAAQIQQVAGDDCCVHCVLACLFCELLSLCSAVAQCLACGQGCEALCCCGGGAAGGMACGEEACSAGLDCGIMEDCCGSSDCLEICLECCSICFPA
ncbi:myoD family inhibitor domain-containing protein [Conger conger]|uniref:myoD family inhibitor domain-containing protein n=1 Tax=Conger conger TaxID=82655 RepID=UPI002A5A49B6|nr:myoD family inhibitor domain-containing protein [Conger conger]